MAHLLLLRKKLELISFHLLVLPCDWRVANVHGYSKDVATLQMNDRNRHYKRVCAH